MLPEWTPMTAYRRGDIVLVRFPHSDLATYKKRPALVVQGNDVETGISQTIVALLTTNLGRTGPTRVRFGKASAEGRAMGLLSDSVVVTDNLATILFREIEKAIGTCPRMREVDTALRQTLGL